MFLYSPCLSNCFWVKNNLQLTHSNIFKCPYFPILDVAWKQPLALWNQVLWRMEPLLPPAYSQGQSHSGIWWCRVMTAFISCHVCLLPNGEMTVLKVNRQLVWKVKYWEAFNPSRQEPVLDFSATACHVHDSGLRPMKPGYVQERQELDSEHSQKLSGHKCQCLDRHTAKPMRLFFLDILRNCLCNIPNFPLHSQIRQDSENTGMIFPPVPKFYVRSLRHPYAGLTYCSRTGFTVSMRRGQ